MVGAATYPLLQTARQRGWCKFVDADPRDYHASLLNVRSSHPELPELAGNTASPYYLSSAQVSCRRRDGWIMGSGWAHFRAHDGYI